MIEVQVSSEFRIGDIHSFVYNSGYKDKRKLILFYYGDKIRSILNA